MVAIGIFAVALTMTAVIIAGITQQTGSTYRTGQSTLKGQTAANELAQILQGITTPANAWVAIGGSPTAVPAAGATGTANLATPTTQTAPCWGSTYYMSPTGTYSTTTPSGFPNAANLPAIQAYDNDLIFCAFRPGNSTPHVYELKYDSSSCSNATYGYCTLGVYDWGTNCDPFDSLQWSNGAVTATACSAGEIESYTNQWCDAYCQGCPPAGTTCTGQASSAVAVAPSPFTLSGVSNPPWYNDSTPSGTVYSPVLPAYRFSCSNLLTSSYLTSGTSCTVSTPPLFCYYGASVPTTNTSCAGLNSPQSPLDLYSAAGANSLTSVQNVTFAFVALADINRGLASPDGTPGTEITENIHLTNVL